MAELTKKELDEKYNQKDLNDVKINKNAIQYYKDAYNFKNKFNPGGILEPIKYLKASYAVDSNGKKYTEYGDDNPYSDYYIFEELFDPSGTYIEDTNSNFNAHKLQVIKNSIESNLITAISNYNKVSTSDVNFAMPKLQEYEWEEITQNICMITFLQGLNIGGKVYNGYAIVPNNHNEDYVSEDSIYILNDGEYHKLTESDLETNLDTNAIGILNTDFERRYTTGTTKINDVEYSTQIYYYPKEEYASYKSIVNANGNNTVKNVYEYLQGASNNPASTKYRLAQIYYTALGR